MWDIPSICPIPPIQNCTYSNQTSTAENYKIKLYIEKTSRRHTSISKDVRKEKSIPLYEFNIYICTYIDNLLQLFQTSHKHVFFLSHQLPKEFHLWAIPTIILKVKYQNNQWNNKESTHLFNLNLLRMRARASTLRVLHTHEEYACFFVCI